MFVGASSGIAAASDRLDLVLGRVVWQRPEGVAQRLVAGDDADGAQDPLLALGAEPGQAAQPARADGGVEVGDGADAELAAELQGPLGADAGHLRDLQDAGRDLRPELVEGGDGAGPPVLGDLARDRGAHAGDLRQGGVGHRPEVARVAGHDLGRLLVVAGAERVAPGDREEFRVLPQHRRRVVVSARHGCHCRSPPRPGVAEGGGPPFRTKPAVTLRQQRVTILRCQ